MGFERRAGAVAGRVSGQGDGMSRLSIFIWYSIGLAITTIWAQDPIKDTVMIMMMIACGTGLLAHWVLNGKAK